MNTRTVPVEPTVVYCTQRYCEDEIHLECRMSDGQKGAFVRIDIEFPELANRIESMLAAAPPSNAAERRVAPNANVNRRNFDRRGHIAQPVNAAATRGADAITSEAGKPSASAAAPMPCVNRTGCETPRDCRERGCCQSPNAVTSYDEATIKARERVRQQIMHDPDIPSDAGLGPVAAPAHTDHPLRHYDRTCPACDSPAKPYVDMSADEFAQASGIAPNSTLPLSAEQVEASWSFLKSFDIDARVLCDQALRAIELERRVAKLLRELALRDRHMLETGKAGIEWPRYQEVFERAEKAEAELSELRKEKS